MITELKLILSRQMRVNERTKLYKQQYEGEQALKELADTTDSTVILDGRAEIAEFRPAADVAEAAS